MVWPRGEASLCKSDNVGSNPITISIPRHLGCLWSPKPAKLRSIRSRGAQWFFSSIGRALDCQSRGSGIVTRKDRQSLFVPWGEVLSASAKVWGKVKVDGLAVVVGDILLVRSRPCGSYVPNVENYSIFPNSLAIVRKLMERHPTAVAAKVSTTRFTTD
jgi:hypothetical protein